ncbi:methylmalonyl-CoA mutase small subunit [Neptunitalea chrysea]|uniref:Methylmalonyl-CoA mutase small subunit n=1 Tax=Neptunitalea chrysea TaxID=1647581 RepID=A0A9W6B3U0_9FLAO|nr:methylmalonyl-CoA mutase family protein [Neptunitalea chrysea]GLB51272.1 methylmalonyl-CoA mutase small subunit [Neptunitalea chrysea]
MEKELDLLKTFPPVSKEEWKQKAIVDLKGADFDRRLVWKTYEGISVQPFYTQEDTENKELASDIFEYQKSGERNWTSYLEIEVVDETEANKLAHKMLHFDATGILFELKNPEQTNLEALLSGLNLGELNISFKTEKPNATFLENYFNYCLSQNVGLNTLKGFYQSDVIEDFITNGTPLDFKEFAKVVAVASKAPEFYGVTIRSHAFADSGANATQEIAFVFNKLVDYITQVTEKSELSAADVLNNTLFNLAIGGDYFFEISKIRAIRLLYQTIASSYGVENTNVKILSSSGLWTKSLFDPNVNMLRNTTEAMSALLGGCDALLIQPHNSSYQKVSDFSHRIALNISNLLKKEAYFDKVVDPAAGSYYLETLTESLAENALSLFKEVEVKNGFVKAFEEGFITGLINKSKNQKEKDITSRKKVFVGTNKYPNLTEKISVKEVEKVSKDTALLHPQRATNAFDTLRLTTVKHFEKTGFIPKVYLACFGNLAMRKARATFAAEFFGIAGFNILGEFLFDNIEAAATSAAESEGDIIVMCASDPDYEANAETFATIFKEKAPGKKLVLAGWPAEIVEKLQTAGVDSFVHVKINAIEALSEYQKMLF